MDFTKRFPKIEKKFILIVILFLVISLFMPGNISFAKDTKEGYKSWITGTTANDGSNPLNPTKVETEDVGEVNAAADDDTPNTITKILAEGVGYIGTKIRKGFMGNGSIDASITGIIMGHIVNGKSFFVFDLTDENIWGKVGAIMYVAVRAIMLVILFVAVSAQVIAPLWKGDSRGGALVKSALLTFTIGVLIITVMPLVVDWVCVVRDELGVVLYKAVNTNIPQGNQTISFTNPKTGVTVSKAVDQGLANTIEGIYYEVYTSQPNIVNAFLYLIVCFLPLAYIINYIKLAIIQTVMFGLFPLFAFVGTMDKGETIKKWCVTFITNALVPCIDMTLILIPSLLLSSIMEGSGIESTNLIIMIILVVCLFAVVPVRNQILGLFGNGGGWGLEKGHTLGGMLASVAGAAAGAIMGAKGIYDNYKESTQGASDSQLSEAEGRDNLSENLSGKVNEGVRSSEDGTDNGEASGDTKEQSDGAMDSGAGESGSGESSENEDENDEKVHEITQEEGDIANMGEESGGDTGNIETEGGGTDSVTAAMAVGNELAGGPSGAESDTGSSENKEDRENSTDKLINDLSVTGSDLSKEAEDTTKDSLAKEISQNSYKATGKGETADHKNFNLNRAANLQSIENMNGAIKNIDQKNADLNRENAKLTKQMSADRQELNKLYAANGLKRDENGNFNKKDVEELKASNQSFRMQANAITDRINVSRDKIEGNKNIINSGNADKAALQTEVSRRKDIEQQYASRYAQAGRTGATFNTVADFSNQLKQEDRARKIVNFSNYKNPEYNGVLSDAQRIQFQREAAKKEALGKIGRGAGIAALGVAAMPIALASGDVNTAGQIMRTVPRVTDGIGAGASLGMVGATRVATTAVAGINQASRAHAAMDAQMVNSFSATLRYQTGRVRNGGDISTPEPQVESPSPTPQEKKPSKENRRDAGYDDYERRQSRFEGSEQRTEKIIENQGGAQTGLSNSLM